GERGWHRVAQAGEEGPAEYIRTAVEVLGVERMDHGVRCLEDAALVAELAEPRIPLTVCPLSNVVLKVVVRMEAHPLPKLIEAGL
ncbi:adenosine deaminase, partial [Cobetia sp. SIMBA_158]